MIWSSPPLPIGPEGAPCVLHLFSSFSSPGSCGWSKPSCLFLLWSGVGFSLGFYFFNDAYREWSEGFQPAFQSDAFQQLSQRSLKMARLCCSYLSWQLSYGWKLFFLSLDFSRCLSCYQWPISESRKAFFSLKLPCHDYGKITIRFVIHRKGTMKFIKESSHSILFLLLFIFMFDPIFS